MNILCLVFIVIMIIYNNQAYDVTSYLKRGDNLLSVYLGNGWYRGRLGYEGGFEKYLGMI